MTVPSGAGHRQAPKLSGGASGGDAVGRAPAVEVPELNRAENSHQPTRQRERAMKRFRTPGAAQRFLAVFSVISPHCRPRRHRLTADDYRTEMADRFATWNDITSRRKPPEPRTSTAPEPPSTLFPLCSNKLTRPASLTTPLPSGTTIPRIEAPTATPVR